jgi:hypothetical protein
MSYKYVVVSSTGHSLDLARVNEPQRTNELAELLQAGWSPVRETPMGSGVDFPQSSTRTAAFVLLLLQSPSLKAPGKLNA